jgi:IclR family pca regulon transcriptional regulator
VTSDNPKNHVNSLAKAFAVLKAFDTGLPELTITEVAAGASIDRGTAFRLIHTLVSLGYVHAVPGSKRFRLGLKCLELGYSVLASHPLHAHAEPLLRALVPEVADAASLGVLDGGDVVYLTRVHTGLGRRDMDRRPGSRTGAYAAALGHAMLAYLPEAEQRTALESTPRVKLSEHTLIALPDLLARLHTVRAQGYAVSDGENAYGLRTVAAPILNADGVPVAGISLTVDASRHSINDFVAQALPHVLRLSTDLGQALHLSLGGIAAASRRAHPLPRQGQDQP